MKVVKNAEHMLMRQDGDFRRDDIVKQEMLDKYFPHKELIEAVIDDRKMVCEMWQRNNLNLINVGTGEDF